MKLTESPINFGTKKIRFKSISYALLNSNRQQSINIRLASSWDYSGIAERRLLNKFSSVGSGGLVRCMRRFSRTSKHDGVLCFRWPFKLFLKVWSQLASSWEDSVIRGRRLLNEFSRSRWLSWAGSLQSRGFSRMPNHDGVLGFRWPFKFFLKVGYSLQPHGRTGAISGRRKLIKFSSGWQSWAGSLHSTRSSRTPVHDQRPSNFDGRSSSSSESDVSLLPHGTQPNLINFVGTKN